MICLCDKVTLNYIVEPSKLEHCRFILLYLAVPSTSPRPRMMKTEHLAVGDLLARLPKNLGHPETSGQQIWKDDSHAIRGFHQLICRISWMHKAILPGSLGDWKFYLQSLLKYHIQQESTTNVEVLFIRTEQSIPYNNGSLIGFSRFFKGELLPICDRRCRTIQTQPALLHFRVVEPCINAQMLEGGTEMMKAASEKITSRKTQRQFSIRFDQSIQNEFKNPRIHISIMVSTKGHA